MKIMVVTWIKLEIFVPFDHDYYLRATLACRTVDCLLDTGSEVCLVPDSLIHSNCIKKTGRSLKAANGTPIPIIGEVKLPLSIGNFSTTIMALVSQHVSEPMLGIDFLVKNQVVWDFAKSTVTIDGVSHLLRSRENRDHWCRRVVVQETNIVPARSETVLIAKVLNQFDQRSVQVNKACACKQASLVDEFVSETVNATTVCDSDDSVTKSQQDSLQTLQSAQEADEENLTPRVYLSHLSKVPIS